MQKDKLNYFLITALGAVFFIPFIGSSHLFDWDEINFAESAREMMITGNYATVQINFEPFWEKPPLFFWMQVLAMKVFGVFDATSSFSPEFGARFPNAIIGIITLFVFYSIGKKLYNAKFGFLWALGYLGSFTPHLYFKSGIIDPTFNLFIFLGVWFISRVLSPTSESLFESKNHTKWTILSGLFIGLAILTKGPVGGLLWGLTIFVYWGLQGFSGQFFKNAIKPVAIAVGVAFLAACIWFGLSIYENGWGLFADFIKYQIRLLTTGDAGHEQPFYYHFVVVLVGCFPISVFAIRYLLNATANNSSNASENFRKWMVVLFWVVMILFTIVKTKIVHYSSMTWFPVSFLAAYHVYHWSEGKIVWQKWVTATLIFIGAVMSIALIAVPIIGQNSAFLIPYIKDPFAVGNLQAKVTWAGWEQYIGAAYLVAIIILVWKRQIQALFISTAICLFLYSAIVVPKIEGYSQGAAISFYQSLKGKDVYVEPVGFKSYAQLFYFQKQPTKIKRTTEEYLHADNLDKPTYFVMKITADSAIKANPKLQLIEEKNGFLFYKRK
ncbi:MAG: ArnT family glycosyltransferase [Spirosomataceae bacterium]